MAPQITAGRQIPDTDADRCQQELDILKTQIAPAILAEFTSRVVARCYGSFQASFKFTDGQVTGFQISGLSEKRLDRTSG